MNDSTQIVDELDESIHSVQAVEAMADGRRSTAELQSRYGLGSRTTLINRMKELGIEPYKEGKIVYVSEQAVQALDALNECLKRPGATLAECAVAIKQQINNSFPLESVESSHSVQAVNGSELTVQNNNGLFNLLETMVHSIDNLAAQFAAKPDPFNNYEQLERFAQKRWMLPTSQLLPLIGLKSIPQLDAHGRFYRMGFVFQRWGKAGNQNQWLVRKQEL